MRRDTFTLGELADAFTGTNVTAMARRLIDAGADLDQEEPARATEVPREALRRLAAIQLEHGITQFADLLEATGGLEPQPVVALLAHDPLSFCRGGKNTLLYRRDDSYYKLVGVWWPISEAEARALYAGPLSEHLASDTEAFPERG